MQRLTEKQRRIIAAVLLHGDASVAEIAEETKMRSHVVRYALDSLKDAGILTPVAFVDVTRLGLSEHASYFSYRCRSEGERQKLLSFLGRYPSTNVVGELAGEYQYAATLVSRRLDAMDEFLGRLARECSGEFGAKSIATRVSWHLFTPKFLTAKIRQIRVSSFGPCNGREVPVTLDALDRKILHYITQPGAPRLSQVARQAGAALSTVEDRVKLLKQRSVSSGCGYQWNSEACGILSYRLLIWQKHGSSELSKRLFDYSSRHPNITSFVHCVGNWDYEVGVRVEESGRVPAIVQDMYSSFEQEIGEIRLLAVLARLKNCYYPFPPTAEIR